MDRQNRISWLAVAALPEHPALVDDLLRAPLNLRVATLHRVKVERCRVGAAGHGTGGAAAHADAHARAAKLDQQTAGRKGNLVRLSGVDHAQPTGNHDRLVIAALLCNFAGLAAAIGRRIAQALFIFAKVAEQVRTTKFIVESGPPKRPFDHDLQGAGDVLRFAVLHVIANPSPLIARPSPVIASLSPVIARLSPVIASEARQSIINWSLTPINCRDGEAGQAGFGFGAAPRCTFVADLATGTRCSTGKRRDRGRVVVRLHFHQDVVGGALLFIDGSTTRTIGCTGNKALHLRALHHRGIVGIRHQHVLRIRLMRMADHAEHAAGLRHAIDRERGIENLVPAVLAIGLRKHH